MSTDGVSHPEFVILRKYLVSEGWIISLQLNDTSEEEFADVLGKYSSDESGSRGASRK